MHWCIRNPHREPGGLARGEGRAAAICRAPGRAWSLHRFRARRKALQVDFGTDDIAHLFLKLVNRERAVEDNEIVGVHHLVIFLEDARLKELETFGAVVGEAEVHAGFVVFELGAATKNAVDGDVEWRTEIESDIGDGSKAVEIAEPTMRTAASRVAGKGGVDVAVSKNEVVALQEGHDLALAAVGEVRRMQQGKGSGSEE